MKKIIGKIGVFALSISFIFVNASIIASAETVSENEVITESESDQDTVDESLEEEASIVVSDTNEQGNVSWTLDSDGLLFVTINGEYKNALGLGLSHETSIEAHKSEVKSIKVTGVGEGDCSALLIGFYDVIEIDLSEFNSSKVTNMRSFFGGCKSLERINLNNLDTSNVTDMSYMFTNCKKLKQIDLSSFNTSNVKYMTQMFCDCSALENLDLSGFDTSNVLSMSSMFEKCTTLKELDLSSFNTSKVSGFSEMFMDCNNLKNVNLSSFNTSRSSNMNAMFKNCSSLKELDLSNFNTKNVENMQAMFSGCKSLEKIDLSSFDTPYLIYINEMFYNCSLLKSVDLSQFNLYNIEADAAKDSFEGIFDNCNNIDTIYLPERIRDDLYLPFSMYDENNNICNMATKDLNVPMQYSRNEFTPGSSSNPSQSNNLSQAEIENQIRAFVSRMYTVVLGREAEEEGLNYWSDQLIQHTYDGAGLARGFIYSDEFTNKGLNNEAYLNILYKTFFDREPDEDGMAYWMGALNNGTSRNTVLAGFVNSKEFAAICDRYGIARGTMEEDGSSTYNAGVRDFVLRMYTKCLKRDGETLGVEYWSHCINTKETSPEDVAKNFFTSAEFVNKNLSNEDYVETLYRTFMDRPSDSRGRLYWVSRLSVSASRNAVLEEFARSQEFAKIMEDFGL